MTVGWARIGLRLPGVRSLKEKRHALRGVLTRLGRDPMIGIAEVGDQDLWGNAEIGVVAVGNNGAHVESLIQHAIDVFDQETGWDVASIERGIDRPG